MDNLLTNNDILTVKEAAEYLHISQWLIGKLVREKKIPHHRWGRRIFFKKSNLDKIIEQKEEKSFIV